MGLYNTVTVICELLGRGTTVAQIKQWGPSYAVSQRLCEALLGGAPPSKYATGARTKRQAMDHSS